MMMRSIKRGQLVAGRRYAELGIVELAGKEYAACGAYVDDRVLVAYLGDDDVLTTWDGEPLGGYVLTASWPTPRSYVSSHRHQVVATLHDGRTYTGRSAGRGMLVRARRLAADRSGRRS